MHMRTLSIVLVAAAAGIVAAAVVGPATALAAAAPRPGQPAPDFSVSVVANGHGTVSLSKLKGHGVYLNFFASWCQPCKAEVPEIAQLSKTYAKRGVVVIGMDELESAAAAGGFAAQYKLPYLIGLDSSGSVGGSYGLIGLPLHIFIGADGKVVMTRAGEMTADQIRAGLDKIARR